jgi:hypothetical protein
MGMNIHSTDPIGNAFRAFSDVNNSITAARESERKAGLEADANARANESHSMQMQVNKLAVGKEKRQQEDEETQRELLAIKADLSKAKDITPEVADRITSVVKKNPRLSKYADSDFRSERSKAVDQFSENMGGYIKSLSDPAFLEENPDIQQRLMDSATQLYSDEIRESRNHDYMFAGFTRPVPVKGKPGSFYLAANWRNKDTGEVHEAPFTTGAGTEPDAPVKEFTVGHFADRLTKERDLIGALDHIDSMRISVGDKDAAKGAESEFALQKENKRMEVWLADPSVAAIMSNSTYGEQAKAVVAAAKSGIAKPDAAFVQLAALSLKTAEESKNEEDARAALSLVLKAEDTLKGAKPLIKKLKSSVELDENGNIIGMKSGAEFKSAVSALKAIDPIIKIAEENWRSEQNNKAQVAAAGARASVANRDELLKLKLEATQNNQDTKAITAEGDKLRAANPDLPEQIIMRQAAINVRAARDVASGGAANNSYSVINLYKEGQDVKTGYFSDSDIKNYVDKWTRQGVSPQDIIAAIPDKKASDVATKLLSSTQTAAPAPAQARSGMAPPSSVPSSPRPQTGAIQINSADLAKLPRNADGTVTYNGKKYKIQN